MSNKNKKSKLVFFLFLVNLRILILFIEGHCNFQDLHNFLFWLQFAYNEFIWERILKQLVCAARMQLLGTVPQPTTPTCNPMSIYFICINKMYRHAREVVTFSLKKKRSWITLTSWSSPFVSSTLSLLEPNICSLSHLSIIKLFNNGHHEVCFPG